MFNKILIANRGEIALRILRTCHRMGIAVVAVHSTADAEAMHVRLADESVCIGPPKAADSYLNIPSILSAALVTGAQAVHPGVGFLSENHQFARKALAHGIKFIGPSVDHLRIMGDKTLAKEAMRKAGLPVLPGSSGTIDEDAAVEMASQIGYPILLKAAAGGGGRGIKIVRTGSELPEMIKRARTEAQAAFGDGRVYLEKYLERPRHIEVQILGDGKGGVLHLGERDCSLQRRHQKLLEESPSPALSESKRTEICSRVVEALRPFHYQGVGTVELLFQDDIFYFLEMNARLQVEHTITEMITGIDLVREQIRIAADEPSIMRQEAIRFHGHAIQCRINAEDSERFTPSPGRVTSWHPAGGPGVRVDSALFDGCSIPPYYDSLAAKLVTWGENREEALMRMRVALSEFVIDGVQTTLPLHRALLYETALCNGEYDIRWLDAYVEKKNQGDDHAPL